MLHDPLQYLDAPAMLGTGADMARVAHTRFRRRVMYGHHRVDVDARLEEQIGTVRREAWGMPDMTANPALQLYSQVAVMYDRDPERHAPPDLLAMIKADGLDAKMRQVQRDAMALREMVVVVDVTGAGLTFRPVFPDLCDATEFPDRPGTLATFCEYRKHEDKWVRDEWSVADPESPYRRVYATDPAAQDITEAVLGRRYEGEPYQWRRGGPGGTPVIPGVIYHAMRAPTLWDPYSFREVFEGTLNVCVLLTYYGHVLRNAAWQQKVFIDCEPAGLGAEGTEGGRRVEIVTDPATGLMLVSREGAGNPQALTLSSPADPEAILRSIGAYERRILQMGGFSTPDVAKQNADIRSGYSLAVSRESIREQQAKSIATFGPADVELMALAAVTANRYLGHAFPEDAPSYRILYRGIPEEPGEEEARIKAIRTRQEAGLIGPIAAYCEANPGTTETEAVAQLVQVATEAETVATATRASLAVQGVTPPTATIPVELLTMARETLSAYAKGEIGREAVLFLLVQAGFSASDAEKAAPVHEEEPEGGKVAPGDDNQTEKEDEDA